MDRCADTVAPRDAPGKSFTDAIHTQALVKAESKVLDSRIERGCQRTGQDPEFCRAALAAGYIVRFYMAQGNRMVLFHAVHPQEVK